MNEIIKYYREKRGLTQYQVAEKSGINQGNYSRIEKFGEGLTLKTLKINIRLDLNF